MAFIHPFMTFPPPQPIEDDFIPKPLEVIPATGETIRLRVNKEDHRVRFSDEDEKFVTVNIEPRE